MEQLKKLKDYGIKFQDVKDVAILLNEADLTDAKINTKTGISGPALLTEVVSTIHAIADSKKGKQIPDPVKEFYKGLDDEIIKSIPEQSAAEAATDERPKGEGAEAEGPKGGGARKPVTLESGKLQDPVTGVESSCPTFLQGYDEKEEDCQACETEFPQEFNACSESTTAQATEKQERQEQTATAKKNSGKRSRYGHMVKTMAARIDDLVYEGTHTKEGMIKIIMDEFNREEKQASNKVNGHLTHLVKNVGIEIHTKKTDQTMKAKRAYAEGRKPSETVSTV